MRVGGHYHYAIIHPSQKETTIRHSKNNRRCCKAMITSTGDITSLSRQRIICTCVIMQIMPIMARMQPPKSMRAGDEKLICNKSWPNVGECKPKFMIINIWYSILYVCVIQSYKYCFVYFLQVQISGSS